ncbi:MAG: hypothetical protein P0Y49_16600 [Candidatus Pedobacter colombiensis]|uniref:DUF4595 domain-containing protein n=1 Tax=Candidatus Pedobacter colombiensis TaxID=3121371 RepID=A0AAJ5W6F1_9SPHI|nr:hypothetical protein [Pedobacter sp.]WEK18410.1 MAG: hypothetical protein P0Y49_16600 [Pedobacter sp.]
MKKSILMLSALCLLIVVSCKKNNKTDDQVSDCLLTENTYVDDAFGVENVSTLYSYDANGRMIGMKFRIGGVTENDECLFTYSTTQIVKVQKEGGDLFTTIYKLNDKGQIISEQYDNDSSVGTYIYNADGYLVEVKYGNMISRKYRYTNGNLTRVDNTNGSYVDYTYNTELAANTGLFSKYHFNEARYTLDSPLKKYLGKQSKNLVSKVRYNSTLHDIGDDAYAETFTYEKDAKGNIIKIRVVVNQNYKYTVSSKYSCK